MNENKGINPNNISNSETITEVGKYILDATQNNGEIEGSLRNEINKIKLNQDSTYLRVDIASLGTGVSLDPNNSADQLHCLKKPNGERAISGILVISDAVKDGNSLLFTVPDGFDFRSSCQGWMIAVNSNTGTVLTCRFIVKSVLLWTSNTIIPGPYIFDFTY